MTSPPSSTTIGIGSRLHRYFAALCDSLRPNAAEEANHQIGAAWFNILDALYTDPARHYHGLAHIENLLGRLGQRGLPMESHGTGLVVETAIYFHDAVYNVASPPGWNEKCSAELARSFLYSLGYHTYPSGYEFIQKVEGAILATVHDGAPTSSPSTKLMLDLDLAGFADAWELFEVNNKAIRQEYASVSDQAYKWGRLKFLAGLAARPAIFYVLTELESPARRNIERHMGDLLADRL